MNKTSIKTVAMAAALLALSLGAQAQEKLTLQLKWVTQAQFAGYYVAKDKGFYKDVGLGFRISAEVARMNVDVVWAAITIAALAGSAFYGLVTLLERSLTFWHPSFRK
jgi:ABC-type nitrate/sulfonate/bicarbonate transport system substrate-binding protein